MYLTIKQTTQRNACIHDNIAAESTEIKRDEIANVILHCLHWR